MGSAYHKHIEGAGKYLLTVLMRRSEVQYSEFFDGSDEAHRLLLENIGSPDVDYPELLMDLAVYQLEDLGIVEKFELDERLVDGEPDYVIILTDEGRMLLEDGFVPTYEDMVL